MLNMQSPTNLQQNSKTAQPGGRTKRKAGKEDKLVKTDKMVEERSATYLVRHFVSAQSVIIVAAEAGL